jgi:outer membrane protein TolC
MITDRFQRYLTGISLGMISIHALLPAQQRTLTLDEALRIADEQSIDIRRARAAAERSAYAVEHARRAFLPEISATANYFVNPQRQVLFVAPDVPFNETGTTQAFPIGSRFSTALSLNITQPLYDPLRRAEKEVAEADVMASSAQLEIARKIVRLNAERAFYRALYARTEQSEREEQISQAMSNLDLTLARFRGGRAMPLDTLTANATVARMRAAAERARYNYLGAKLTLARILDLPDYENLEVSGTLDLPLPPGPSGGAMIATEGGMNSPEARAAETRRAAAEADVRVQSLTSAPTINAVANVMTGGESNSINPADYRWAMTSQLGIILYYPIFNLWRSDPKREEAQMRVREAEIELEGIRKSDSAQRQQFLLDMQAARAELRAEEAALEQGKKAIEIAMILYKEGRASLPDLEAAQSRVTETRLAAERAKLEFMEVYAELKSILMERP